MSLNDDDRKYLMQILGDNKLAKILFQKLREGYQDDINLWRSIEKIAGKKYPDVKALVSLARKTREAMTDHLNIIDTYITHTNTFEEHVFSIFQFIMNKLELSKKQLEKLEGLRTQTITTKDRELLDWMHDYIKRSGGAPNI